MIVMKGAVKAVKERAVTSVESDDHTQTMKRLVKRLVKGMIVKRIVKRIVKGNTDLDAGETQIRQRPPVDTSSPLTGGRQVAFSVSKFDRLKGSGRLTFQDVLSNVGSGYRRNSGNFIAPSFGTYFFIFHAVGAADSDFTVSLFHNNQYQVTAYGTRETCEHGSNSVVLRLRRGDSVSLQLTQGEIYEHPANEAYTSFSGCLLF